MPSSAPYSLPQTLVPVLLAGGSGSRLWPLSRELHPKQFLRLNGDHSLLQEAALRVARLKGATPPIVIGNEAHRFLIAEHLREVGLPGSVVLEPSSRNTAPAAAVAAQMIARQHGPDALMLLLPADQLIGDADAFLAAVTLACSIACDEGFVTFGVQPRHAETGFGYMKVGLERGDGSFEVERFIEKPDLEAAAAYIDSGDYYWNAGMFVVRAGYFLEELQRLEPVLHEKAADCLRQASIEADFVRLHAASFSQCIDKSVDYALLEHASQISLVPLDAAWDDVGSWRFLERGVADAAGNRVQGDAVCEDSSGNLVLSESRLIGLLGVVDHVVVETSDAILIAHKSRIQDVKKLVIRLKAEKRREAESHCRVYRPWGYYESIAAGPRFQVKRIVVAPGQKLSLQMHHHRAEHWIVVRGTALVTCGERRFLLAEDQSTYIPLGSSHRLENPGKVTLEVVEIQSGAYLGEDDIARFEDIYGRTPAADAEPQPPRVDVMPQVVEAA